MTTIGIIAITIYIYSIVKQVHNYIVMRDMNGNDRIRRSFILGYIILTFWTICIYKDWKDHQYYCSLALAINGFIFYSGGDLKWFVMAPVNLIKRLWRR